MEVFMRTVTPGFWMTALQQNTIRLQIDEMADHAPEGVKIPRDVVLGCVKTAFEQGETSADSDHPALDLEAEGKDHMLHLAVVLALGIPGSASGQIYWKYSFPLTPIPLDRVDVLEGQLRDLQATAEVLQQAARPSGRVTIPVEIAGVWTLRVHRIEATFPSTAVSGEQKRLGMAFSINGNAGRTEFKMPGEEIEQTWSLAVRDAPDNDELSIELVQEHCARPLAAGKWPLSDFVCGFHERKITFQFGPKASPTTMELFFYCDWFPGSKSG
ncbi:hypothetical protein BBJ28_00008923 [Nothophytophthora sp. Chile5]|nr:hypothetical protein BBJ28_00008923 [Nothophytophthora sp. Chile5]